MNGKRQKRQGGRFWKCAWITLCVLLLLGSLIVFALGIALSVSFERTLPDSFWSLTAKGISPQFYHYQFEDRTNRVGQSEVLTDAFFSQQTSRYVLYGELPQHVRDAFVAIEDKRFFEHRGVDWYRTAAAGVNYLLGFSDSFGASTVTQQLVKNLTGNSEVSLRRKMQEIFYALDLERTLDKSEILELYLNVIHFSEHCDGIGAAAERYFSKSPQELTVSEGATLAAIINNPSYYNPIRNPQNNKHRRDLILSEMHAQGMLDDGVYQNAVAEPLTLNVSERENGGGISSWYTDMVIEDVIGDLCMEYGMSRGAASSLVYSGGLKIYTAMDLDVQKTVEDYYQNEIRVPINEKGERAQSALIVIDNKTGDILGVAGAVGKKTGNRIRNHATQTLRPPGSALKPISVYAPALEKGLIHWASVFDDTPTDFGENGRLWPQNANRSYRGLTNIAYAMAESTNTISVKILEKIGISDAFRIAKEKFHIRNLVDGVEKTDRDRAALALGQLNYGVTLRELATAYTVFADAGMYHPYRSYYRVLDADGNLLLSCPDGGEAVMTAGNAAIMTKLLQKVVRDGTASSIQLQKTVECAGKTGTTNAEGDRWFVGYTPEIICGVWCGYEYPEPLNNKNVCLNVWDAVVGRVSEQIGGETKFDVPSSVVKVTYCKDSGKLPCEACGYDPRGNRTEVGWFVRGTEPHEMCDCHVLCDYDTEDGGVCHAGCPEESRRKVALLQVERHFPIEITVADAQYVYRGDPNEIEPNPNTREAYFLSLLSDYCGRSNTQTPFNRSCTALHEVAQEAEETPWWQRYFGSLSDRKKE